VDCVLIAEGVETKAERRALGALGVQLAQGYLLGRPEPIDAQALPSRRGGNAAPSPTP
jgi:EAL domain-containing protein (putative c-di-GMP-specific phosphodiesterase class I)